MPSSVVKTLQQLIATPSVNPAASISPVEGCTEPPFGESRLTDHLQQWASDLGLDWLRQQVHPDRDNLLVVLPGQNASGGSASEGSAPPPLLWEVHQDTVAVEGMTIDPFGGELRNDRDGARIYGRGACDVKGGMAAMMTAFQRLAAERPANCPTIVLAFAINEEFGFSGSKALTQLWRRASDVPLPRPRGGARGGGSSRLNRRRLLAERFSRKTFSHTHPAEQSLPNRPT